MSRYTGPKCKLCRREGVKLFLKGEKCETEKCPIFRRQQAPGQHGRRRVRSKPYLSQLREKQKVKRIYGVLEQQFRRYVEEAFKEQGQTGTLLLSLLERRLDNALYRMGMALSRSHGRQQVIHGKIKVNGQVVKSPSYLVDKADVISYVEGSPRVREVDEPAWLSWDEKEKQGEVVRLPDEDDLDREINTQLIVEFYSR
jgi:small subunit ribosomal protein S4